MKAPRDTYQGCQNHTFPPSSPMANTQLRIVLCTEGLHEEQTWFAIFASPGRLAQLVQSTSFTPRGSGVRVPHRPPATRPLRCRGFFVPYNRFKHQTGSGHLNAAWGIAAHAPPQTSCLNPNHIVCSQRDQASAMHQRVMLQFLPTTPASHSQPSRGSWLRNVQRTTNTSRLQEQSHHRRCILSDTAPTRHADVHLVSSSVFQVPPLFW